MKKVLLLIIISAWSYSTLQAKELKLKAFKVTSENNLNSALGIKSSTYKGYVVTTNKDTFIGYIKMLSPIYNSIRVQFIHEESKKLEIFKSEELLSYSFKINDSLADTDSEEWVQYEKHYIDQPSIPFGTNEVLLYKAQSGKIDLYHHFYENHLTPEIPICLTFFIKIDNENLIHLTKNNYKLILDGLIDKKAIKDNIQKSNYEDIEHLVKQFNQTNELISIN